MRLLINSRLAGNTAVFALLAAWLTITVVAYERAKPGTQVASADQTVVQR
jgi:hypothetical protein